MRKNSNKIYKITVGIPAHNEAGNITRLLKSLIVQKLPHGFELKTIKVLSDGSTDETAKKVKEIKDKRIKVYDFKSRMGKNYRLNELFRSLNEDILVLFDADILISNNFVLANLTKPFAELNKPGLVAGNAQPLEAETLIEEGINNFVSALNFMKSKINNGHNIFSVRGPVVALSRDFARKVVFPLKVPDDRYLFLKNLELGFDFYYSEKALVCYRSPQTIKDQINQGYRFKKDKENLYRYFDRSVIEGQYFIPFYLKVLMFVYQIVMNPVAYLAMKFTHFQIIKNNNKQQNHKWQMVLSSKRLIQL